MMKLSDFDVKDFDFSDTEKYDDFDRFFMFIVVLGIDTQEHYNKVKFFCQNPEQFCREHVQTFERT